MQYILTESEYASLVKANERFLEEQKSILQDLCTKVCDNLPVNRSWSESKKKEPWGCMLTQKCGYCDQCPVQDVCPYEYKEWSK